DPCKRLALDVGRNAERVVEQEDRRRPIGFRDPLGVGEREDEGREENRAGDRSRDRSAALQSGTAPSGEDRDERQEQEEQQKPGLSETHGPTSRRANPNPKSQIPTNAASP